MQNNSLALRPLQVGWLLTLPLCQQTRVQLKSHQPTTQGATRAPPVWTGPTENPGPQGATGGAWGREHVVFPNSPVLGCISWQHPMGADSHGRSARAGSRGLFPPRGRSMHREALCLGMRGLWGLRTAVCPCDLQRDSLQSCLDRHLHGVAQVWRKPLYSAEHGPNMVRILILPSRFPRRSLSAEQGVKTVYMRLPNPQYLQRSLSFAIPFYRLGN